MGQALLPGLNDGIEFFGGTVNCSNLAVAYCGDDLFDFDEGYTGKCQFVLGITNTEKGDHLAEHSGNSEGYAQNSIENPGFEDQISSYHLIFFLQLLNSKILQTTPTNGMRK